MLLSFLSYVFIQSDISDIQILSYQEGNIFMVRDTELIIISHHHTNSDAQLVGTYHNAPE